MKHLGEIIIILEVVACLIIAITDNNKEILNYEKLPSIECQISGGYYEN